MNEELQQIETAVNSFVTKPLARLVYGLKIVTRWGIHNAVRGGSWVRQRWAAMRSVA
jgi:hypothetical protein